MYKNKSVCFKFAFSVLKYSKLRNMKSVSTDQKSKSALFKELNKKTELIKILLDKGPHSLPPYCSGFTLPT